MEYTLLIAAAFGGLLSETARRVSIRMIKNRTGQPVENPLLNNRFSPLYWILAGSLGCVAIMLLAVDVLSGFEYMLIYVILVSIAIIDHYIRKIPNELILSLLIVKLAAVAIGLNFAALLPALGGFVAGIVIFILPSKLGIGIGWGDVKLAAAAGFCLGIMGVLQAVLIMSAVLALYLLFLTVTKKGNLKTKVAIGPSLSIGMLVSLLFPLAI